MNFLTQTYLAGSSEDRIFGSLLGSNIKVNTYFKYNSETLKGIDLSKRINEFTFNHPSYFKSRERLNPKFRKYAPLLIGIFYDHFLAAGWKDHANTPLDMYAENIYQILRNKSSILPYKLKIISPVMTGSNWMTSFATLKGTHASIKEMIHICTFQSNLEYAFMDLMEKYPLYKDDFKALFPELKDFVSKVERFENKEAYTMVKAS
jgi:acyl carrier protein phosphodiesterase